MKILVPIKRAADYPHSINPYDLVALEQALCLREASRISEVLVVSIGSDDSQETLRSALAMGADRAIFVCTDEETESLLQPLAIAKILANLVHQEQPGLLILGRQAVGGDYGQTGQMLSALLDWPQASFVSQLKLTSSHSCESKNPADINNNLDPSLRWDDSIGAQNELQVIREVDNGLQILSLQLPAVITVNLCLNEPRVVSIPNILKAQKKPFDMIRLEDLEADIQPRFFVRKLTPVKLQRAGIKVNSVAELIQKLRYEAKVL